MPPGFVCSRVVSLESLGCSTLALGGIPFSAFYGVGGFCWLFVWFLLLAQYSFTLDLVTTFPHIFSSLLDFFLCWLEG